VSQIYSVRVLNFSKIAASLLLGIMFFCVSKNSILLALYQLDTAAFVTLFCENKDRPKLKCNGQCKIAEMAKEQDRKDGALVLSNLQTEIFLFYQEPLDLTKGLPNSRIANKEILDYHTYHYSFIFLSRSDKPPEFLS